MELCHDNREEIKGSRKNVYSEYQNIIFVQLESELGKSTFLIRSQNKNLRMIQWLDSLLFLFERV